MPFIMFFALIVFKLGIIGTDTSHATAFANLLNGGTVQGAKIVAAYKGGSADVESSRTRVDKYADELKTKWGVEIVGDIPTLASKVDGILLLSVDGRTHLPQFRAALAAKKPVFIDKPLASTLADAREIDRLAKAAGVSCSARPACATARSFRPSKAPEFSVP
jgi:predicted dehydrogenase